MQRGSLIKGNRIDGLGSRLYFCCFYRGGRETQGAWHNNLINLESCVDGSPIFLSSIGTRINSLRDGSSYKFFIARCPHAARSTRLLTVMDLPR
jgi:hypothetical protein